jgi:hypothetical protein
MSTGYPVSPSMAEVARGMLAGMASLGILFSAAFIVAVGVPPSLRSIPSVALLPEPLPIPPRKNNKHHPCNRYGG